MANKFYATVRFIPAYWNKRAFCNVPARWTAEVHDGLPDGTFIYSDGCESRQEAVDDLITSLRTHGFTGNLIIQKV